MGWESSRRSRTATGISRVEIVGIAQRRGKKESGRGEREEGEEDKEDCENVKKRGPMKTKKWLVGFCRAFNGSLRVSIVDDGLNEEGKFFRGRASDDR